jgi:methyl coenzyme M reductase alpha subunit
MGKASFQAVHIPTVVSRTADGGQTSRWMAMQVGMSFISAYHPAMVDDCYVKVFTGDDALKDELDPQFVIDIDKMFRPDHAAQIKASMGKSSFQAVHIPTVVSRTADGGQTSRWMAMQVGMSFISAYHMCAGEAAVADLAFTARGSARKSHLRASTTIWKC